MKQKSETPIHPRTIRVEVRDASIPAYTVSVATQQETQVIRSVVYVHKPNAKSAKKRGAK